MSGSSSWLPSMLPELSVTNLMSSKASTPSTLKSAHANIWFNPGPTCSDQALLPPLPNSAHAPRPAPPLNLAPLLPPAALPVPPLLAAPVQAHLVHPALDLLAADPPAPDHLKANMLYVFKTIDTKHSFPFFIPSKLLELQNSIILNAYHDDF